METAAYQLPVYSTTSPLIAQLGSPTFDAVLLRRAGQFGIPQQPYFIASARAAIRQAPSGVARDAVNVALRALPDHGNRCRG